MIDFLVSRLKPAAYPSRLGPNGCPQYEIEPGRWVSRQRITQIRNRAKHNARVATKYALRTGALKRQPCEVCGGPDAECHHVDYARPLDVRWLCHAHHREADRRLHRHHATAPYNDQICRIAEAIGCGARVVRRIRSRASVDSTELAVDCRLTADEVQRVKAMLRESGLERTRPSQTSV